MKEEWKLSERLPTFLCSILNSNIQKEENRILYTEGLVKAATDGGNKDLIVD